MVAELQTAGRGRLDRTWEAEPGAALLVSVLLRPADLPGARWHLLDRRRRAGRPGRLRRGGRIHPDLKWPNDLLVGDRKLAGILAESRRAGAVVVGMGLNVHGAPPGAAWVDEAAGRRVDRAGLLVAWLRALDGFSATGTTFWPPTVRRAPRSAGEVGRASGGDESRWAGPSIDGDGRLVVAPATLAREVAVVGRGRHLTCAPPGRPAPRPASVGR